MWEWPQTVHTNTRCESGHKQYTYYSSTNSTHTTVVHSNSRCGSDTYSYYKGVRQFYHNPYHSTKIKIVNKLPAISRKPGVFLDEENMPRYRLRGESISIMGKNSPPPPPKLPQVTMMPNSLITP